MDFLYPYGGALVAPFAAAYVGSLLARFQTNGGRRPNWAAVVLALAFGVLIAWLLTFQLDTFRPWRWQVVDARVKLEWLLCASGFLSLLTSVLPVRLLIWRYQKSYDRRQASVYDVANHTTGKIPAVMDPVHRENNEQQTAA